MEPVRSRGSAMETTGTLKWPRHNKRRRFNNRNVTDGGFFNKNNLLCCAPHLRPEPELLLSSWHKSGWSEPQTWWLLLTHWPSVPDFIPIINTIICRSFTKSIKFFVSEFWIICISYKLLHRKHRQTRITSILFEQEVATMRLNVCHTGSFHGSFFYSVVLF